MTDKSLSPLTHWRKANGITQAELATKMGVKDAAVTKWEKGQVPAERVLRLSKITQIPPHRLRPDLYPAPDMQGAA
jgi:transcriptional regulator with XRE-family HTH domain